MAAAMSAVSKAQKAAKVLSSKKSECVQVVVRTRPIFGKEVAEDRKVIVTCDPSLGTVAIRNPQAPPTDPPRTFTFDACYGPNTQQKDMYDISASPIVDSVLEGFNGTIFAYGQTGAGKTHSMEGLMDPPSEQGIMPNAFKHIFDTISGNTDPTKQFLVRASYIELYNEEIHDLLGKDVTQRKDLRDSTDRGVFVQDLTAQVVKSADEMNRVLTAGKKGRHTGATLMNKQSSRSHSIFTVTVETSEVGADGKPHIRVGKLNLVDLAGSERQSKTGATGQRLKEATKINLSLSALGNVIGALVDGKSKHIPYRDSKLTRLLQDSLGGNTKTMMVACVGPADYNFDESMSTLRYADRAKQIKNKPRINEDPKDAMLREFQEEIERLKAALAGQGGAGGTTTVMVNGQEMQVPTGGGQPQIIEKIVGISEEEAAALRERQQRAEEEAKSASEARAKLAASAAKTEEERQALAAELERAAAVQRKQDEESSRMARQLQAMQEKLLQGGQIMDRAAKQEAELRQVKLEVEQRRKQEAQLARELAERELELQDRYASVDEKLEDTTRKLRKAVAKYKEAKREIKDLTAEWQDEKAGMLDVARELDKERSLYLTLLKAFVPPAEVERLEARAVWDDAKDVWFIPYPQLAGARLNPRHPNVAGEDEPPSHRPVSEFARERAAFDENPRYLVENILKFTLDEVDRTTEDYEGPEAHGRIPLMGEEEEEAAMGRGGSRAARPASARRGASGTGGSSRRKAAAGGVAADMYPAARGLVRD